MRPFALEKNMGFTIKFTETPKTCKDCNHWNANNRKCALKACAYKAKRSGRSC